MKGNCLRKSIDVEVAPYLQADFPIQREAEVARKYWLWIFVVALVFAGLAGLGEGVADPNVTVLAAQPAVGVYELSFQRTDGEPATTLPVCTPSACEELVLKAHITEKTSGLSAQRGVAIFQYCSLTGLPPNDITRPDEAPSEACDVLGTGTWANLGALKVNGSGDAFLDFGIVLIPRTVGFRFRYIAQGSGIANGVSQSEDFTWTQ